MFSLPILNKVQKQTVTHSVTSYSPKVLPLPTSVPYREEVIFPIIEQQTEFEEESIPVRSSPVKKKREKKAPAMKRVPREHFVENLRSLPPVPEYTQETNLQGISLSLPEQLNINLLKPK